LASIFPGGIPSAGPYIFNYADVGAVNLWMQNSASPGQVGASGTFVVKPGGFVLSGIMRTSDSFANPAAANAAGTKFVKAGEMFSVTVTATTCTPASATCTVAGVATPNYGNETAAEGVMLASTLVAPVGGSNPAVGGTFGAFTNGVATGAAFIWDEVGIINLTPSVSDGDYLGLGDVTGTASGNVGRFYPHHFDTAVTATATTPMPCPTGLTCPTLYDGFIYSGQPFSVQVFARNLGGNTTANYDGTLGFSKGTTLTAWDALGGTTQNPGSGVLGSNTVVAAAFGSGAATLTDTPAYTFGTSPTAPTDIYVRADDTDGVTSLRAISVEGGIKVVSGRILVPNAYGSNLLPLPLTVTAQYYTASGWVTSVTDSVTSVTVAANYDVVKNGSPIGTTAPAPTGVATLNSGQRTIVLGKPTGNASGVATISPGAPTYLPVIPGTATFGIYKGNNEFIYLRESY
jgi:MSHA biogenesis protein MshQ